MLDPELVALRHKARAYATEHVAPQAARWESEGKIPRAVAQDLGGLGFLGMLTTKAWGGRESGYLAFALVLEELAAGDGALSTLVSINNGIGPLPIQDFGTDAQKRRWLADLSAGRALAAFALSEPQAGSDAAALTARAERQGKDGWRLNGTKAFITLGASADLVVVFAVTDPAAGKKGLSAFIVPTATPGYRVVSNPPKLGQRSSDTCTIAFEDMDLPADALLGGEGQGYGIALSILESGRIGIAAQCLGLARAALDAARTYAKERQAFGKAIADHQAVAFRLADMATELEAARALVHHAARLKDSGASALKEASMAKLFASEMVERVASAAIQVHGGYGYMEDLPLARIYRDSRACQIYEGTSDIQRMVIARAVLAED
ncbi:MAG: acyl-CoA dehydrogenase family protein [Rhodospirillales bacterium]